MPLRQADKESTRRFEDDGAWLVLRLELTKGEADAVRDISASYSLDPQQVAANPEAARLEIQNLTADANRALFDILCQSWSMPDPPNAEAYDVLDQESGEWVDDCIAEVLKERRLRAEKKARSSTRPSARARSSARAASSRSSRGTKRSSTAQSAS